MIRKSYKGKKWEETDENKNWSKRKKVVMWKKTNMGGTSDENKKGWGERIRIKKGKSKEEGGSNLRGFKGGVKTRFRSVYTYIHTLHL